jgi:two-component system phosphate regulon sensor histidine kinase PhoR
MIRPPEPDVRHAEALRDRFLSTLCHELRTPLAAVGACSEILGAGSAMPGSEPFRRFQDVLSRESRRLVRLFEALIAFERTAPRTPGDGRAPVDLAELLAEAAFLLEPLAESRQVRLKLQACQADTRIQASRDQLRQLVLHLGSNAIQFTPQGGAVTVRLESDAHHVSLEVEDTGVGIPEEALERVFERFYQVEVPFRQGAGLGLALCRSIAESHGGDISVVSRIDRGSRFTVKLPRDRESQHEDIRVTTTKSALVRESGSAEPPFIPAETRG